MTEQNFKNRKGLITFAGVLHLLAGMLCALFCVLIASSIGIQHTLPANMQSDIRDLLPGILIYGSVGTMLVFVAIGSFNLKRWARSLALVFNTYLFAVGIGAFFMVISLDLGAFIGPAMQQSGADLSELQVNMDLMVASIKYISAFVVFLIFILFPGLMIIIYMGDNAKLTFEHADRKTYWTEKVPLPVLIICVAFAAGALFYIPVLLNGVNVLMTHILVGAPAYAMSLGIMALLVFSTYWIYNQKPQAWKLSILTLLMAYGVPSLSFLVVDIEEYFQAFAVSRPRLSQPAPDMMAQFWENSGMMTSVLCFNAFILVFILWSRKFFNESAR